MYIAHRTVVL